MKALDIINIMLVGGMVAILVHIAFNDEPVSRPSSTCVVGQGSTN